MSLTTYTQFVAEHQGACFWHCDAGADDTGAALLDVLAYATEEDLDADDDNSLAIARQTVIDDRDDPAPATIAEILASSNI
jgi:protein tyrosine/serine phosphatase